MFTMQPASVLLSALPRHLQKPYLRNSRVANTTISTIVPLPYSSLDVEAVCHYFDDFSRVYAPANTLTARAKTRRDTRNAPTDITRPSIFGIEDGNDLFFLYITRDSLDNGGRPEGRLQVLSQAWTLFVRLRLILAPRPGNHASPKTPSGPARYMQLTLAVWPQQRRAQSNDYRKRSRRAIMSLEAILESGSSKFTRLRPWNSGSRISSCYRVQHHLDEASTTTPFHGMSDLRTSKVLIMCSPHPRYGGKDYRSRGMTHQSLGQPTEHQANGIIQLGSFQAPPHSEIPPQEKNSIQCRYTGGYNDYKSRNKII
ncbi:uncharacterized protein BDR25DRAFT_362698 [Lindgomyces ingoldianus]|uniref:Uncharacterized protein n=1 Tax=Lindgomyces ingoldianus TaxID=673940 RepID=A0ACB6Q9H1_9PLEO|nr:uncharacterized protein BDR25DRAFT_362698 [Lindgomyces ingoldianus]KAF2463530.1 hypothetical protein BDR25DRAFT_362698 [Lindgomyces ingoldianus]